ncbi:MAG: TRAP transporter substrate-binding protein [Chloroflexota bacterium]|nr:TRAP transporter substrate-binding protein [Chloroflexota bacterium]
MKRREFLRKAAIGVTGSAAAVTLGSCTVGVPTTGQTAAGASAAAAGVSEAAAAVAQDSSLPTVNWRLASSFPSSLETIYGGATKLSERVAAMTGNRFNIRVHAGGELFPALQVLDNVQNGTVECGHTVGYYYIGKDPTFAFGSALPFGLNAQQQNAWLYQGGGLERLREFYKTYNVIPFPGGNTGAQMGGWFKREVNSLADLQGLKMRIGGTGGPVMTKLGVSTQQIPGGEIYQALETGVIDATEWVGPYDDEKLGFNRVAQFYYYPGWWEPGPTVEFQINLDAWNALPPLYQEILRTATYEVNLNMLSQYEVLNREALTRLVSAGTQLRAYSPEILQAAERAANELFEEYSGKYPAFKEIFAEWSAFRQSVYAYNKINEGTLSQYIYNTIQ